jgi:hypothetical protein
MSDAAYIAFDGDRRIASGELRDVARAAKQMLDRRKDAAILVFDSRTSAPVDIDFRGSVDDVLARLPAMSTSVAATENTEEQVPRGPGRPKLGVVAREVTLLPRHWDWLSKQKGGASVAIRRLVEDARRSGDDRDSVRMAQDSAYRFMSAMAGNRPHYEEAIRALFANDAARFRELIADWPADVRDHIAQHAEQAFRRDAQVRSG